MDVVDILLWFLGLGLGILGLYLNRKGEKK
jgi:hypothetical protein